MKETIKKIIPNFILDGYHFVLAFLGALIYGFPSRKLKVVGVTGTNGKTTVVDFTVRVLEGAGYKVAALSSIYFKVGEKEWLNRLRMTMPGRFKIQKFLRQAVKAKCDYVVLEVTSEGILQHRQRFINFLGVIFTNLSPEHIERHGGFENYKQAKGKLFAKVKEMHIINIEDKHAAYFLKFKAHKKYTYGLYEGDINNKDIRFNLKLIGEFNTYNALAATAFALSQGISLNLCKQILEKIEGIPGRMEVVVTRPFKVIVDYAFTPAALEKVYATLKNKEAGRLICVLGACGGGRDKWKRPVLGGIAANYCDQIIITNEDPYEEDPEQILSEIKSGVFSFQYPEDSFYEILDRRTAIKKALSLAKDKDTVIITGKGCETSIVIGNKQIPWDDRKVVQEELNRIIVN